MPRSATSIRKTHAGANAAMTQTLGRGLEVLRAFRCEAKPLGNRTIAQRTGLPKSTVSRITSTLVSLGYLNKLPSAGHYQIGTGVLGIGDAYLGTSEIRREARPLMERFAARHDVSMGLAMADDLDMMYIVWCRSPKTLTLRLSAGSKLPIGRTAIGKAYLWALPAAARRDLIARIRQDAGARARAVMDAINNAFADLDRYGYCISIAEFQKNTFGIAVPLVFDDGQTILSLNAGGARLDVTEASLRRNIAADLIETAVQLRAAVAEARAAEF
jgi:DNA-binding IclR family transcriptional regulator